MGELRKDIGRIQVAPSTPAVSGAAPIPFRLYAPPLPYGLGWRYRSASRYVTVEQLQQMVAVGTAIDMTGAIPVYQNVPGGRALVGYQYPGDPIISSPGQFPAWARAPYAGNGGGYTGPFEYMRSVVFPGVTKMANGYPVAPSDAILPGYFDTETDAGPLRVWRDYRQTQGGVWMPIDPVDPFGHTTINGVTMLADFNGRPYRQFRPARFGYDYYGGWNAGANSVETLDADVRTKFKTDAKFGIAVGLYRGLRNDVAFYENLSNCFYIALGGDSLNAYVMELGSIVSGPFAVSSSSEYEIARVGAVVTYSIDGVAQYVSKNLSHGPVSVGTAIYHGGEGVL